MKEIGKLRHLTSIYLTRGDKILLLYRQGSRVVNDQWVSSAGGHFEPDELNDACACALRELYEELGITLDMIDHLQMRYVTLYNNPKDLRQNYYFFAELKDEVSDVFSSNEGISKWFSLSEISELDMPFTSKMVTEHWLQVGRFNSMLYTGISTNSTMMFHELTEFDS